MEKKICDGESLKCICITSADGEIGIFKNCLTIFVYHAHALTAAVAHRSRNQKVASVPTLIFFSRSYDPEHTQQNQIRVHSHLELYI